MFLANAQSQETNAQRICVIGLGGGAGHAIDAMADAWVGGPHLAVINTDAHALSLSRAPTKLQIGRDVTDDGGTGGDVSTGRVAAERDAEMIQGLLENLDLVVLVVCLGGGVGTGAAPIVLKLAREMGITTLCFATLPFAFEGRQRASTAEAGLRELHDVADTVIVIPNQRLVDAFGADAGVSRVFHATDELLCSGVGALWRMITTNGTINIGFGDLQRVVRQSGGTCCFGYGAATGENRVDDAVTAAANCPLLIGENALRDSRSVLVSLLGGPDTSLRDVDRAMTAIGALLHPEAHVAMGMMVDDEPGDRFAVLIIAAESWNASPVAPAALRDASAATDAEMVAPDKEADRKGQRITQTSLALDSAGKGRFRNVEPTVLDGEDLDIPTFIRRGIAIEK